MRNSFIPHLLQARRSLHLRMARPALAWRHTGIPVDLSKVIVTSARWHNKFQRVGDIRGGTYAEVLDDTPRIITLTEEYRPRRGDVITLANRAFRVDAAYPDDEITTTAHCIELTPAETSGFPFPTPSILADVTLPPIGG